VRAFDVGSNHMQADTTDLLTPIQAYRAMIAFLDAYWRSTHSDDIASLLGDLQLLGTDSAYPADPAAWSDWLQSIQHAVLAETPETTQLIQQVAFNPQHFQGQTIWGSNWYAMLLEDGTQFWVQTHHESIIAAGRNRQPRAFNPSTGVGPSI
jgi:hypothetical protein